MVLCTNYDFLKVMMQNLPDELKSVKFFIVLEDRLQRTPSKRNVQLMMEEFKLKYKVLRSEDIIKWFKVYTKLDVPFIDNYTMGLNILSQAYFFKETKFDGVLFVDDDVIFSEGTLDILKNKESQMKYYRLSAGPATKEGLSVEGARVYDELAKTTGFRGTYEDYIKNHISSGNRFLSRNDFKVDIYIKMLIRFFKSELFEEKWAYYKETGKGKMAAFFLDEKFETMAYHRLGNLNFGLEPLVKLEVSKPEKLSNKKLINKPIWHNATSSHKYKTLEILRERGEII